MAACGAPIVGWLAERLGFEGDDTGGGGGGGGGVGGGGAAGSDLSQDIKRARALGDAVVICTAVRARRGAAAPATVSAGRARPFMHKHTPLARSSAHPRP